MLFDYSMLISVCKAKAPNKRAHVLAPENNNMMLSQARTKRMPFIIAERPSVLK